MISSFYYNGRPFDKWEFQDTKLNGVNLLVGASGSGKTRYLNSIFNISSSIVQGQPFRSGRWELIVKTDEYEYLWEYDGGENQVQREIVARKRIDSQEQFENLIDRTGASLPGPSLPLSTFPHSSTWFDKLTNQAQGPSSRHRRLKDRGRRKLRTQAGNTPSCLNSPNTSHDSQTSWIFSSLMRYTATPATAAFFPVAAMPMKLPSWVPANVQRAATFWP